MIFRELLDHFSIQEEFPEYLYSQTFNKVFLDGEFTFENDNYKLEVTTRQNVTHQMFLRPDDDYPVVIMSILPNGNQNGMKFGRFESDVKYINNI